MGKTKKMADDTGGLLDSDSEDSGSKGSEVQEKERLSINKKFAKEFEKQKQKQELHRARLENGSDQEEDDEDDSSEDEDGELLTKKLDTNIFKTLNALKNKDKEIYEPDTRFFKQENDQDDDEEMESPKRAKKEKRKTYKDVVRDQILEEMDEDEAGKKSDPEETEGVKRSQLAYDDEQRDIRKAFLQSTVGESDEEDADDLMVVKHRTKGNKDDEDDGEFLEEIEKLEKKLKDRGDKSDVVDPKGEVKDGDKFLLNFFKNRSWIDQNDAESSESSEEDEDEKVPMKPDKVKDSADGNESDESLEQLEKNDDFEARYNFRFEAAEAAGSHSGADFSNVGYARGQTMDTLRRKDDSRAQKRQLRKERKEAERRAKEEQLKRLKNAKRAEMESKLQEIKKVLGEVEEGGEGDAAIDEAAIMKMMEGDYDPEKLDKLMAETFGDEFYEKEDAKWKSDQDVRKALEDEEGVVADEGLYDDENADEDEQEEEGNDDEEAWVEEEEYGDEEYYAEGESEKPESELEKKIKSKMADELYKLDYEDIIAGMPTRFKYRKVEPNDYGLTTQEILFARDSSLRQYVSLKKMAPYREDEEYAVHRNKRRAFRDLLERDLEETTKSEPEPEVVAEQTETTPDESGEGAEKKKKKRRRSKKRSASVDGAQEGTAGEDDMEKAEDKPAGKEVAEVDPESKGDDSESAPKKKKRRKRKKSDTKAENESTNEADKEKDASIPKDPPSSSVKNDSSSKATVDRVDGGGDKKEPETQSPTTLTTTLQLADKEKSKKTKLSSEEKKKKFKSPKPSSSSDKKKKSKKAKIEGITASRLSSYGF